MGDTVRLEDGAQGCVVFNSISGEYSDGYPRAEWDYLDEAGLMVMTGDAGLAFYPRSGIEIRDIEILLAPARSLATLARVRVGDWVLIERAVEGQAVFNAFSGECSDANPQAENSRDEDNGLMIERENGARIFYPLDSFSDYGEAIEVLRPAKATG